MEKVIKWVQGGCLMWRGGAGCGRAAAHDIIDISSAHYTVHYAGMVGGDCWASRKLFGHQH